MVRNYLFGSQSIYFCLVTHSDRSKIEFKISIICITTHNIKVQNSDIKVWIKDLVWHTDLKFPYMVSFYLKVLCRLHTFWPKNCVMNCNPLIIHTPYYYNGWLHNIIWFITCLNSSEQSGIPICKSLQCSNHFIILYM